MCLHMTPGMIDCMSWTHGFKKARSPRHGIGARSLEVMPHTLTVWHLESVKL